MRFNPVWRLCMILSLPALSYAVKCLDCVGRDCMGSFCEGEYCVLGQYAPRWGTTQWGSPRVVKGCMNGTLLRKDIRDHCEAADEDGDDVFTCFCNGKDHCNGGRAVRALEVDVVPLVTCMCSGMHCKGEKTCLGEMCTYVLDHSTKEYEQGCVNATIPLIERRSLGACMIPPITGAMHHTLGKQPEDLLKTESCVCGKDYCNVDKPKVTVKETTKCQTFVKATMMGTKMKSRTISCTGEFCFKANIKSNLGQLSEYSTIGCASFTGDDELAEELNPTGCASFRSEQLNVNACFKTDDESAIGRARANQEVKSPRRKVQKSRRPRPTKAPKMEIAYEDDEQWDNEEEEEEPEPRTREPVREKEERKEREEEKEEREENEEEVESTFKKVERVIEEEVEGADSTTKKNFIFQKPTQAPIPDDSNTTMITVFILIMLCIVVSGAVWKLELHKKLMRSNYDTVAGG